jgi:DNA invertase Pin-like site-specific DNA recombinase
MHTKNVYGIYARRSSTDETRQVQSIDRQLTDLQRVVDDEKLAMSRRQYIEEQSAFKIGRKVFGELVKATKKGTINCWLCWHPNRLARNATDAGKIIQLMDDGHLLEIKTPTKTYYNTSNDKTFLMIDLTFSKRDSDDKSEIVKSGIRKRYERGYPTGLPPLEYKLMQHTSTRSTWVVDPVRHILIQKVLKRFLRGDLSIREITQYAHKIGLRTTRRVRSNGALVSSQLVYSRILKNPVYAGFFKTAEGERYSLNAELPRAITEDQHRRILATLSFRGTSQTRKSPIHFRYKALLQDEWGRTLITENKHQLGCSCGHKFAYKQKERCPRCLTLLSEIQDPKYLAYTYYGSRILDEKGVYRTRSISETKIGVLLLNYLRSFQESGQKEEILKALEQEELDSMKNESTRGKSVSEWTAQVKIQKKRLRDLASDGLITTEEFKEDLFRLDTELDSFQEEEKVSVSEGFRETLQILDKFHRILQKEDQTE